jgi:HlyD family secretion protein
MTDPSIYRQAALDKLSTPDRLGQGLVIVGRASWALLLALAVLVVGGLIWSMVMVVPVTVNGQGILLNPGGVLDVVSGTQGRLVKLFVATGAIVRPGMTVAQVDQPQLRRQLEQAEGELVDLSENRRQTFDFQAHRRQVLGASVAARRKGFEENIEFLKRDIDWLKQLVTALEDLDRRGNTTREKLLEARTDLGRRQEELLRNISGVKQLDDEEIKLRTEDEKTLLDLDLKLTAASRKAATARSQLRDETFVKSTYSGKVAEMKVNPGEVVERGTALFTIVPEDTVQNSGELRRPADPSEIGPLSAVIYVVPSAGKKVMPGATARISVSTAPREEYGVMEGRVRSVAEIPSTAEGMERRLKNKELVKTMSQNAAPFEIVIDLYADKSTPSGYRWSSSQGPTIKINDGTLVQADLEVRKLPLLGLVVPALRQVFGWENAAPAPSQAPPAASAPPAAPSAAKP